MYCTVDILATTEAIEWWDFAGTTRDHKLSANLVRIRVIINH